MTDVERAARAQPGWLERVKRLALAIPLPQSQTRRAVDSQAHWASADAPTWAADSHIRSSVDGWDRIGGEHRALFLDFARAIGADSTPARVLEWGSGGGANAVHFAPDASEFIAVDVSEPALAECRRQVATVAETTFTPVLISVQRPEDAVDLVPGHVDLFLCFYVIELLPSRDYARRVMEVAARLVRPGGLAVVQVKYQTRSPLTWSRTWAYRRGVASMTSFAIDEFWSLADDCGFDPHSVRLVPRNHLDERYAYYFLVRR